MPGTGLRLVEIIAKSMLPDTSFKLGLELDLNDGTLDVYKNDKRLGTLKSGLVGEYCWVVSLGSYDAQVSVSIGR